MAGRWIRRWAPALIATFAARTAYAGLIHGPLVLTPLVYARFPTAMNATMNLPALLAVEALVSWLVVASYGAYFRDRRPVVSSALLFGFWIGLLLYAPQNLLNWILLKPVRAPLVGAWIGAGIGGGLVSTVVCWLFDPRRAGPSSDQTP